MLIASEGQRGIESVYRLINQILQHRTRLIQAESDAFVCLLCPPVMLSRMGVDKASEADIGFSGFFSQRLPDGIILLVVLHELAGLCLVGYYFW